MLELACILVLSFSMVATMIKSREVITRYTRRSEESVQNYQASIGEMTREYSVSLERISQGYRESVASMGRMYSSSMSEKDVRYKSQFESLIEMVREMQAGHIAQIAEVETIITQRYMDGSVMIKRNVLAG